MPPSTPTSKQLIDDLEHCADSGEIDRNDSIMFNDALLAGDDLKLLSVFVGDPIERAGKIIFTVKAFDAKGDFDI